MSPYCLLFGVEPLLPFDLTEAFFIVENYRAEMSTIDLLTARLRQIEKKEKDITQAAAVLKAHCLKSKEQFEQHFATRLYKGSYLPGSLILVKKLTSRKQFKSENFIILY